MPARRSTHGSTSPPPVVSPEFQVSLLTGGFDRPYVCGLARALAMKRIALEVIANNNAICPEMSSISHLTIRSFYWELQKTNNPGIKLLHVLKFYFRMLAYTATGRPKLFHILWNNKVPFFDRTLLMLYYKLLGKKIVFTAHNVNSGKRDSDDSLFNRLTLKIQYRLADHILVHTEKMKTELAADFAVPESTITVIPFGINNCVRNTDLTRAEARRRLTIDANDRTILFFGNIRPYKGLEYLVHAFSQLRGNFRLIIAGEPKQGTDKYFEVIQQAIHRAGVGVRISTNYKYISDEEIEVYFKGADVCALPYTFIFQSGVLLLSYRFGLPVIATDVGSLSEDVIPGKTGFICRPRDSEHLATTIKHYFDSDLYHTLECRRQEIKEFANKRFSWDVVGDLTRNVYANILEGSR